MKLSSLARSRPAGRLADLAALAVLVSLVLFFFWKILLTNLILVGVDTFLYFYPYKAYAAEALRQGRLPLWNPHLFMGAPLLANSQVALFYVPNWLFLWLEAPKQVAWSIALHILLAGGLMLAFTRRALGLGRAAGLASAILFAFGGYLGAQVEHINQLNAAAWLPLLFLLYHAGLHRPRRQLWFLLLALVIAVILLAGHAQTTYISLFGLGLYGLWLGMGEWANGRTSERANERTGEQANGRISLPGGKISPAALFSLGGSLARSLLPLAAASALGAALAAVQLAPTIELSGLSIRSGGLSYREAVSFSLRPTILHYSLLPPLGLDLSQVLGQAFGEWVAYLGLSGLILALMGGLLARWRPEIRPFVWLAGWGLLLSLGLFSGPLYPLLYLLAPGFDLFRAPARWLLLYAFGAAVLAGYGFDALGEPATLRYHLGSAWGWLRVRRRRLLLFIALPLLFLTLLIINKPPPLLTLLAWFALALAAAALISAVLRLPPSKGSQPPSTLAPPPSTLQLPPSNFSRSNFSRSILLLLLIAELFLAAQSLNYNRPTAPQAFTSLRNAVAFLLAADPPEGPAGPPDRFLSLSGITYDPGDLTELRQIYGDRLSAGGMYDLIVATKAKEVLFYNLPLLYRLHSVDGYDGGILPLAQFVTMQRLFLPEDDLSVDGRLREKLRYVPPGRLLSLLNTRWVITDKLFDVWIDDVFYDLQFPARLAPSQAIATTEIPDFPATAIGLVSHLEQAAELPAGTVVAEVELTFADGTRERFQLEAGRDTAEGSYPADAAHPQATVGVAWPYEAAGVDYVTVFELSRQPAALNRLSVTALLPGGQFILRGVTLIHQPTGTGRSLLLSTEGDYQQVHSGDVKIYENRAALPRAFVVHQALVTETEAQAIAALKDPAFDPATTLVRLPRDDEPPGLITAGRPSPNDRATITRYQPERVEIDLSLAGPGWLVLADTHYPGWQASLDEQPVEIFQANILFRAVAVPAGEHTLVFEFKPRSRQIGAIISLAALLLLAAGLVITLTGKKAGR